jgi:hypothetical protein
MGFSSYLRNKILDHVFGATAYTAPGTVYISLHTADPGDNGANEASGTGYARKSVTNNTTNFPNASAGAKSNGAAVDFAAAGGNWSSSANMTHYGIWDASSSGNFLGGGSLAVAKPVLSGDTASFPTGDIDLTLT